MGPPSRPRAPIAGPGSSDAHVRVAADLCGLLSNDWARGALIGGLAASLLGNPRGTVDVDALTLADLGDLDRFAKSAAARGFTARRRDAIAFARRSRVLLLEHRKTGIPVDVSFGVLPFERRAVERAIRVRSGGVVLRVVRPEDLVVMKAVAARPRDWEDIRRIAELGHPIRWTVVRRIVSEFARVLEDPERIAVLDRVIAEVHGRSPRRRRRARSP